MHKDYFNLTNINYTKKSTIDKLGDRIATVLFYVRMV